MSSTRKTLSDLLRQAAAIFFFLTCLHHTGEAQSTADAVRTIHIKFKERFVPQKPIRPQSAHSGLARLDAISAKHRALRMSRIFPEAGEYETAHRAYGLHLWYEVEFERGANINTAITDYRNSSYFDQVEEVRPYTRNVGSNGITPELSTGTNDPLFGSQWHFNNTGQSGGTPGADINLLNAWKIETGSPNVIVAVIDGGIDLRHPDLAGALWTNSDEIAGNGIDDDANGYVDDIHGYCFADQSPTIFPDFHATHVAGVVGAVSNNGIGVSGIAGGSGSADGVRLMSCVGFGEFNIGNFGEALVYAADNGAVIAQNSWGGGPPSIEAAINYFIARAGYDNSDANFNLNIQTGPMAGGLVVFAAGNSNTSNESQGYPASYKNVIAVASTDNKDVKSSFSNFGSWVDISAPGSDVFSTFSSSGFKSLTGTSMACPHVSGVAALVVSHLQRPGLTPGEIWNRIRLTARPIYAENPYIASMLGAGRLDAFVALQEPDAIPPDAISTLHATEVHYSSVNLEWIATGASGNEGQAADYEIRYSPNPITDENFSQGSLVMDAPSPPPAGQLVSMIINDLYPAKAYYFAMRSRDLFNNISLISNIVTINTPTPPVAELISTEVSEQLFTGGISTKNILVRNTGGDDLWLRASIPDIDPAPVALPTGATARLFVINTSVSAIEELNPKTGTVMRSIPMPVASTKGAEGLAFDGKYLYYGSGGEIHKLNVTTGAVLRSFKIDGISTIEALDWSGRYLYVSDFDSHATYEVDADDGMIVRNFELWDHGLTSAGNRGTLFTSGSSSLVEVSLATGLLIREVGGYYTQLAYSEVSGVIFGSDHSTTIKVIDAETGAILYTLPHSPTTALASDGYKPGWLITDEQVLKIPPSSTGEIPITFIATGLGDGHFTGNVSVISMNGKSSPLPVTVNLDVVAALDLEVLGSLDFGTQYLGYSIDTLLTVENRGWSELIISDIHSDDVRITTSFSSITLAPGEKAPLTVTVTPNGIETIDASLVFTSNDPDESTLIMPIKVEVNPVPAIEIAPASLSATINAGEDTTLTFTVKNTGGSVLHWSTNFLRSDLQGFSPSSVEIVQATDSLSPSAVGDFTLMAPSLEAVTCLSVDPRSGFIYGRSTYGNNFYRYDPRSDTWANIGFAPESFAGQAAYLNNKIYYGGNQLNIYDIETQLWSSAAFPEAGTTGTLTSDGQAVYVAFTSRNFYRFDPVGDTWMQLATGPPRLAPYGGLSFRGGEICAHESHIFTGDGNTAFYKYYIESNSWVGFPSIPGKTVAGGAIDPGTRSYYVLGSPAQRPGVRIQMSIFDLAEGTWQKKALPFAVGGNSSLVFVGHEGISGLYFSEGQGTRFVRYETAASADWMSITPASGDLVPGETQQMIVKLSAAGLDAGDYSGNIKVFSNHPPLEGALSLDVTVIGAPDISLSGEPTDLGDVVLGILSGMTITIKNTGTDVLTVDSVTSDNPAFYILDSSFTIQTGQWVDAVIRFRPTQPGQQSGTFTFYNNDLDEGTIQFVLSGNGVYPSITEITPDSISAELWTGGQSLQDLTISNTGGSAFRYEISATPYNGWLGKGFLGQVPAGEKVILKVTIDAKGKSSGKYLGTLRVWCPSTDSVSEVPVTMTVTSAADIWTKAQELSYGDRFVGYTYDDTMYIKNDGVLPLSVSSVVSDNPVFTIVTQAPVTLSPGDSIGVAIRFTPMVPGNLTGSVTVISDDPDEGTYIISLDVNVLERPVVSTAMQLAASLLTNEVETQALLLGNSGGSTLRWKIIQTSNGQEEPVAPGEFTSLAPAPFISLAYDPVSGRLYAQNTANHWLGAYNAGSQTWSNKADINLSGIYKYKSGGAVFHRSKMYAVYTGNSENIAVYDPVLVDWTLVANGLGVGTGTITSDGSVLYVAGGGKFMSFDPETGIWTDLPVPMINLDGKGGLSYYDGAIYAHEGTGSGFAKYTITTRCWENLVPLPDRAVLGSAIDPVRKRYYAYGGNNNSYLYEYDIAANIWDVFDITFFNVEDGGIAYFPHPELPGIYFLQGLSGSGFARYEPRSHPNWLRISPVTGEIPPSGNQAVGIHYNAFKLNTGTYKRIIQVISNDPETDTLEIPVTLSVKYPGPVMSVRTAYHQTVGRLKPYPAVLQIENRGPAALEWYLPGPFPPWLTVGQSSGTVADSSSYFIPVTIDASGFETDLAECILEIHSNDLFNPAVRTVLKVTVVENHAPFVSNPIPTKRLAVGRTDLSLAGVFSDIDNDPLSYSATSSNPSVATVLGGPTLTIFADTVGIVDITVTAKDVFYYTATTTFTAHVSLHVTSIEQPDQTDLHAIPNPFTKDVSIVYNAVNPGKATVCIYDVAGKAVWQTELAELAGRNEITVDGRHLANGLHHCRIVRHDNTISNVRIVKN